ncbi:NUDIX domain-containing protein [Streptomyces sp. NBC_01498]|uniref:NUDIX hydrolase n=1 Tax=Streptomyces sp. NBC_01498 TaxID=2975870 RepID=UPI002E7ADF98|nr:NUDIX domain-containing protein [Streptomyces sp. NBC_01498]WTL24997.1 NUDIX domain-containing protein [Streptomyces sp. NBC_01498]
MSERVEHVDENDQVLGVVEREEAVRKRWPHRVAATFCRDPAGRILVVRRARTLARFPGYYDVTVGGAVDVGESYEAAAGRELAEELGVGAPVRFLFKFLCRGGVSPYWLGAHEALVPTAVLPDPAVIDWWDWMTMADLLDVVDEWGFTPGGREALHRYVTSGPGRGPGPRDGDGEEKRPARQ